MKPVTPLESRVIMNMTDAQLDRAVEASIKRWGDSPDDQVKERTALVFIAEQERRASSV
jgi:hypothetical protein